MTTNRGIALTRVSQYDDDSPHSPEVQKLAALRVAARENVPLAAADIWDENVDGNGSVRNVSGSWGLANRPKFK